MEEEPDLQPLFGNRPNFRKPSPLECGYPSPETEIKRNRKAEDGKDSEKTGNEETQPRTGSRLTFAAWVSHSHGIDTVC